ncbi:class I SAM-dependent methyltransferase [Paraburkholderia unamae]|nr:class I SAM-dependent methyltransferase [Paraburkholderia unamae]
MGNSSLQSAVRDWLDLNDRRIFEDASLRSRVAPFPPPELMQAVSATDNEQHFAMHGTHIFEAISKSSPKSLSEFASILDFGCGCGRLGRMFLGHPSKIVGCDIDTRHVEWINANLTHMSAVKSEPNKPLPFDDGSFDAIISVSVFSHITEVSQEFYLTELSRIAKQGAYLFLSTHGETAFRKVRTSERMFSLVGIPAEALPDASSRMDGGQYAFIRQGAGHPTESDYDYGITFIPTTYVLDKWNRHFEIVEIVPGAIHDWQDIVVCRKR